VRGRGTCEQLIKEGKRAIKWTRYLPDAIPPPVWHAANAVRLQLHALGYNLGNFPRTLATTTAFWKTTWQVFQEILGLIAELRPHPPPMPA
jgi:hypothetical protein